MFFKFLSKFFSHCKSEVVEKNEVPRSVTLRLIFRTPFENRRVSCLLRQIRDPISEPVGEMYEEKEF